MATSQAAPSPASSGGSQRRRRVLMFPLPFQGHLNPMLQLAGALRERAGLVDVTVFHAAFCAPDPARRPAWCRFVPVGEGVPSADLLPSGSDADFAGALLRINERLRGPFRDRLRQVLDEEDGAPACLVVDSNMRDMHMVAEELGVPTLVLRTGGAACLVAYMAFPELCDKGLLPPSSQDQGQLDMPLSELPPLRLRDMLFSSAATHAAMAKCLERLVESSRCSSGVIINTFQELEDSELQKITNGLGVPVYAIGPLHKISSGTESSLLEQDRTCLEWLDKQQTNSVLYVSFGSLASMDEKELLEIAWGLANSHMPFLWVIRHNMVQSSREVGLPHGFKEATCGRGMVVPWAPQLDVLGHRAVGGFWTHNGWNSTIESICEGVPMISRPQFADQMINARYVQEVWKIGFELEGDLERGTIQRAVRKLLCEEEGREMRKRAENLKDKSVQCIEGGGSSDATMNLLMRHLMSF
ncbi:hypothetical protein ACP70R_048078 [Stipagrostis hirtigluma subsp. patula]